MLPGTSQPYWIALFAKNKEESIGLTILCIRPAPSQFTTKILYPIWRYGIGVWTELCGGYRWFDTTLENRRDRRGDEIHLINWMQLTPCSWKLCFIKFISLCSSLPTHYGSQFYRYDLKKCLWQCWLREASLKHVKFCIPANYTSLQSCHTYLIWVGGCHSAASKRHRLISQWQHFVVCCVRNLKQGNRDRLVLLCTTLRITFPTNLAKRYACHLFIISNQRWTHRYSEP